MSATLKATLHVRKFDMWDADESAAYYALVSEVESRPGANRAMRALGHESRKPGDYTVEVETDFIFSNQWNTTDSRVFDTYTPVRISGNGVAPTGAVHWLELTPELLEARRNQMVCGYCGNREPAAKGIDFCPKCLGSKYLKRSELRLTRMLSASLDLPDRAPLSDGEQGRIGPLYDEAQKVARKADTEKAITDTIARAERAIVVAQENRNTLLWLVENGVYDLDNWIYYDHTGRWCYGWRNPVQSVPDALTESPFDYDVKWAEGYPK